MRMKSLTIKNYRSCRETSFNPHPQLSALIGINGSGKTTVLSAILFLRKIVGWGPWGRSNEKASNQCTLRIDFEFEGKIIHYEAVVDYTTTERNPEEITNTDEKWNLESITGQDQWVSFPSFLLRARREESKYMFAEYVHWKRRAIAHGKEIVTPGDLPESFMKEPILPVVQRIVGFISRISYYSASQYTNPSECPVYVTLEEDEYRHRSHGRHAKFLHDLYLFKEKNPDGFQEYKSIVGKQGLKLVDNIEFHPIRVPSSEVEVRTGGRIVKKEIKRVLVVPHFVIHNTKLSPSQLSEGTFKTLAVLLYLSTDTTELLLLEEPEVCIHHGLLSSLMELIKSHSQQKQIIVSTHSDFVLDQLKPENVFLVNNSRASGTIVESLPESVSARGYKALKEYLNTSGNLGEYWRHAGFEDV
jgi:ABC-type Mn2+/Zn2+ transport system ATPase subunit